MLSSSVGGAVCDGVVDEVVDVVVALLVGKLEKDEGEELVGGTDGVDVGVEDGVVESDVEVEVLVEVVDVELTAAEAVLLGFAEVNVEVDLGSPNKPVTTEPRPPD